MGGRPRKTRSHSRLFFLPTECFLHIFLKDNQECQLLITFYLSSTFIDMASTAATHVSCAGNTTACVLNV